MRNAAPRWGAARPTRRAALLLASLVLHLPAPFRVSAQTEGNPGLDEDTSLSLGFAGNLMVCNKPPSVPCGPETAALVAGTQITSLTLIAPTTNFFPSTGLANARLTIVDSSVTSDLLQREPNSCDPRYESTLVAGAAVVYNGLGTFSIANRYIPPFGLLTQLGERDRTDRGWLRMSLADSTVPLEFRMGGQFKICYSQDGLFGGGAAPSNVMMQTLQVWGVYDKRPECRDDDSCLRTKITRCYVLKGAYNNPEGNFTFNTSCIVDYTYDMAGYQGNKAADYPRVSWSSEYSATYDVTGTQVGDIQFATCGSDPAGFLCRNTSGCGFFDYFKPTFYDPGLQFIFPTAINTLGNDTIPSFGPRTVAACYCPFGQCNRNSQFKQQVGLLLYYASKVCYNGLAGESSCDKDFTGAAPQHRFSVRVLCPPGGCTGGTQNLIKIVAQRRNNDLPSWTTSFDSSVTGCASAMHGVNRLGKVVLPLDDNPDVSTINGRMRQDFKIWNWKRNTSSGTLNVSDPINSGFMFNMGYSDYEKRNGGGGETFDVCYCDDMCDTAGNWFKVGQLRFAPFQLISAANSTASTQDRFVIQYANQPGILGFYRQPVDRGIYGLTDNSIVKLVADPYANLTDTDCMADLTLPFDPKYDRTLIFPGPIIDYYYRTAITNYAGATNNSVDANKMLFNSGNSSNLITVRRAGFLAVCYCASQVGGVCFDNHWVLAARLTIRGPQQGHSWVMSTFVVFRLEYEGWGLTSKDQIRIIPQNENCLDGSSDQYGPRGSFTVTSIKLGCPFPCSEVGEPTSSVNGGIQTQVYADDAYLCNDQNTDCRTNEIRAVTVLDASRTLLEFEKPHGLSDGDLITLGDNIVCNPDDTADECNPDRLAVLKGQYNFADTTMGTKPPLAPSTYFAGHVVTTVPTNDKMVTIPVGWPTAPLRPRFRVLFRNNQRGRWTRHSKAITKLEIMGTRAMENLKVCWAYSTPTYPWYTTEVGTLTLQDANIMQGCLLTLTTLVKNQASPWAPFILSFRTAGSETGKRYSQVQGVTQLRLFFTSSTDSLKATFGDGQEIDVNTGEDTFDQARQYICGKLFREMWSSNPDLGFPMPRGCYYTVYGTTQEINIIFDRKNGLKGGEDYQMVMTGIAMEGAMANQPYATIFTMDDYELSPYTAIERGQALLSLSPMSPAYGADGVRFMRPDGVKVTGSTTADMMELTGSNKIQIAFKGDSTGGGIKASSILRIFLWPLTQWNVAQRCTAMCIPYDDVSAPCGAVQDCRGDSLVANFQKNYLKIVLPSNMAKMTEEISHTIVVSDLVYPKGGFFPTRFGVELRKSGDTKPDYMETTGNFFFKVPDDGASVGKVVEYWGDGDDRPFKGDQMNVLYAQIMLASTLFSALQSSDAQLQVVLPEGYECLVPETFDGSNPWQAPANLGVFGYTIPQGTGSPFEADAWSGNGNICQYSLRQNGVIYAGSSLVLRITVNNPNVPLKRTDGSNRWQVVLKSKGFYSYQKQFPPVFFGSDASRGNFSSNKPVLGRLTEAKIVPSVFAVSTDYINVQMSWLRIFFRTEQETGVNAQVRLVPARGFVFPNPCSARDISLTPFSYYNEYAVGMQMPTRRLPGILGCQAVGWPGQQVPSHVAIRLTGSLLEDTYYAFEIQVQNDFTYNDAERNTWQIFTTDGEGNRVDGTPRLNNTYGSSGFNSSIAMAAITSSNPALMNAAPAFGLYRRELSTAATPVMVSISDMTPYSFKGFARVNVSFQLPAGMGATFTTLRITAPEGYLWRCTGSDFSGDSIAAPTTQEANVLLWSARLFAMNVLYRIRCKIMVPDASPTHSVNDFLFEMGHAGTTFATRYAASSIPITAVAAVVSAGVDYRQNTNLEDPPNELNFQLETITSLKAGGAVYITGPGGFDIAAAASRPLLGFPISRTCVPQAAAPERGSPYEVLSDACCPSALCAQRCPVVLSLPADINCQLQSLPGDPIRLMLIVGPSGLPAGRYRFMLQAINPGTPTTNAVNSSMPCGKDVCWGFYTLTNATQMANIADAPTYAPAFDINRRLVESGLSTLTNLQQALTGRDDRPLMQNSLVFFFKLTRQMVNPSVLQIRAPQGFVFQEDCLSSVEVRSNEVYGANMPMATGDTAWPVDVVVTGCRGEGPNAYIYTDPGQGQGFLGDTRYPFRVDVRNPQTQPSTSENRWSISYGDESSRPFTGFMLWTFMRTTAPPLPVTIGASPADSSLAKLWNPVTFTFAPMNTVSGVGMQIRVTAPPSFRIANTKLKSRILVQPVSEVPGPGSGDQPPMPKYDSRPSQIWGDSEISCDVDAGTTRTLTATLLSDSRELTAGRDYQITVFIFNPMQVVAADQNNQWVLETYNSIGASPVLPLFRDRITLPGFAVVDTPMRWLLRNQDPATGVTFYNGLQVVPQLYFEMQFPAKLETTKGATLGDVIVIETPAGYQWVNCLTTFNWEPPQNFELYLPNSPRICVNATGPLDRSNMTIRIQEPLAIPAMRNIKFRVNARNPTKTPHVMLNHWKITHYNGVTGKIMSTTAAESWSIIPQLANVKIELVGNGIPKAAGMQSRVSISFVPISDADQLTLRARLPLGFDFTGCTALTTGHEIVATDLDTVKVRASMYAGVQTNIIIDNFKLGQIGGATLFDLVTNLNNGEKMDESLGFQGGFELPGALQVLRKTIDSNFTLHPMSYPGQREVRMQESAIIVFEIKVTREAVPGSLISMSSPLYTLLPNDFLITRVPGGMIVPSEVVSYVDGSLVAQLVGSSIKPTTPGFDTPSYKVSVRVLTPSSPAPTASMWRIEVRKPGASASLPLDTNDALTQGFRLVDNIILHIRRAPANEAPPMAEVAVELFVDPKSTSPTEMVLVAPAMYNFSDNCLVSGGRKGEIVSCMRGPDDPTGRATARLKTKPGGISGPTDYVVIKITTPAQDSSDPDMRKWFIDCRDTRTGLQLGWGEDPDGVTIRQMAGAAVVFSSVPQVSGQLAVRFYTSDKVDAGGKIRVIYPRSIVILCDGAFLSKVALQGDVTCINDPREGMFDLVMARPLPPGQQAFTVTATPPDQIDDPGGNIFKILLYTPDGKVVDAAMNVPGERIMHGLTAVASDLIWSSSIPLRASTVSLGFELTAEMPEKDPPLISDIVVTMPDTVEQKVTRISSLEQNGDQNLPLREGNYLEITNPKRLVLLLDAQRTAKLKVGRYRWAFPVMIPSQMPKYNVYQITLCMPDPTGSNQSCSGDPQDPRALTTFPLAGFDLGQENPSSMQFMATAGGYREGPLPFFWHFLALLVLPLAQWAVCL